MMKWVASCSGLVVGAVAIGACYGTIDGTDSEEVAVQDRAALVTQKRRWLEGFDRHCDACFAAFDLCKLGAEPDELESCRIAMDACVRGGLLGEDDADASVDGDAAVEEDPDAVDASFEDDADAGVDPDAEVDGGDDVIVDDDAGLDVPDDDDADEDADESADEDAIAEEDIDGGAGDDDAGDAGLDDRERAKEVLISEIGQCLELARGCLEPEDADAAQCVSGLQQCVQQALEEAFEVICTEQVRACRAEKQSRANVERVERECRANLLI
ncbi:MAG: hypothetical protein ABW252_16670 [Polyangiales bacterium]